MFKNVDIKRRIVITVVVVILAVIFISIIYNTLKTKESEIDNTYLLATLREQSELTTAELKYTGMSEFKDEGFFLINKSDFIMVYEATARAGIDIENVTVETDETNKTIWITIPEATILDVDVDLNNIRYFDEQFALLNVDYKEDANEANAMAEDLAREELKSTGILEMANKQAEALIKGLLQESVRDYEIKVKK